MLAPQTIFISRAGADSEMAVRVAETVRAMGFAVVFQDGDFANRNFIESMHAAISGADRVVALLSPAYLESDHCSAEWQNALAADPLNRKGRLVVMRVTECEPVGMLAGIAYWDLVPVLSDDAAFAALVQRALGGAAEAPAGRPAAAVAAPAGRLPLTATRLIGREPEAAELGELVRANQLVTLVGMGGLGKTRLGLRVAGDVAEHFPDGAWFVDFAPLGDPNLVATTVATALGVRVAPGRPPADIIVAALRRSKMLIVLDNCEHVIGTAAEIAEAILQGCEHVRLLATSRQPLAVAGEQTYRLQPLALPPLDAPVTAESALQSAAVSLFVERARASDGRFVLDDRGAPAVAEIVRRLDGIPLAIELAAARVKVLGAASIARRLDERFRMLTGGSRGLARQHTLRAMIDWSHDLLSENERVLFRRLSVFAGGWTLDLAEAACAADGLEAGDILDLLSSLIDKSLVIAQTGTDPERYSFLESTASYATEKLRESGETAAVEERHARAVAQLADRFKEGAYVQSVFLLMLRAELDNARAALEWAVAVPGRLAIAAQILDEFMLVFRYSAAVEAATYVKRGLALADPDDDAASAAALWLVFAAVTRGSESRAAARAAADLYDRAGDAYGRAFARSELALGLADSEEVEAGLALAREAFAIAENVPPARRHRLEAPCHLALAWLNLQAGAYDEARKNASASLGLYLQAGLDVYAAIARENLAEVEAASGNVGRALLLGEEAVSVLRHYGIFELASANVAAYALEAGEDARAQTAALEALSSARKAGYPDDAHVVVEHVAALAARRGAVHRAAGLMGFVDAWYRSKQMVRSPTEQRLNALLRDALQGRLGESEIAGLARDGSQMRDEEAFDLAWTLIAP
jgi:predicted ATPase